MSIWEKLAGAATELVRGSPIGALLGGDQEQDGPAENHPDKLMARGVPKEFVAIATEKVAAINGAYGEIAKERGI